ncbi:MAG: hypothetical protein HYU54_02410 [Actinobacteria bacterium]|nr:hypothetical protein [Actinomycetota bacterium]
MARLVRAAGAPPTVGELVREQEAVAAAEETVLAQPARSVLPTPRRSKVRSRLFRAKVAGLVVVGTLAGTTGLAAAGVLPDPAQNVVSDVLAKVGISVPAGDDHPASTGTDISGIATTTDATGVEKGAEISDAASDGVSQAGQQGSPDQGSTPPVTTPNEGGTGTGDTASGGASEAGTTTADEASQGRGAEGSGGNATATALPTPDPAP